MNPCYAFKIKTLAHQITYACILCAGLQTSTNSQTTSPSFDSLWAHQFKEALSSVSVQGASVAVTWPGEGMFIGTIGESSPGVPVTPDMQFGIGSNTKLFTAVLALRLQELGYFSLDDPLSDWLPDLPNVNETATIRQSLSHLSGVFDFSNDIDWRDSAIVHGPDTFFTTQMILNRLGPPHFEPGTAFAYSNTGYWLTGLAMEAATGKSYVELLHEYIFDPLDMDSTFVAAYEEPNGNVANGWYFGEDLGNNPLTAPFSLYGPAGSIFSTASEMVQWYTHLFEGNILSEASFKQLINFEPSSFYGLGVETVVQPELPDEIIYAHRGDVPGYSSQMGWDIRRRSALCILNNQFDYSNSTFTVLLPIIQTLYSNFPLYNHDAAIESIEEPGFNICSPEIEPAIKIRNDGRKPMYSLAIEYWIDDQPHHYFTWSGELQPAENLFVFLPGVNPAAGENTIYACVSNPNGLIDSASWNNKVEKKFYNKAGTPAFKRLDEDFEDDVFPPESWFNGNNLKFNWGHSRIMQLNGTGSAVKSNWFDLSGRSYDLELPKLDLSEVSHPILKYDWAFGFTPGYSDALEISISTDCGTSYTSLYYAAAEDLMTAETNSLFFPQNEQWKTNTIDLGEFTNNEVWIKFTAHTDYGNNLYIDNVLVENILASEENLPSNSAISLEPNPAHSIVKITSPFNEGDLAVYDVLGKQCVREKLASDTHQLDVSALLPGLYLIKISNGDASGIKMLAIEH